MPDAELIALLQQTANALDAEAAWLVDVDITDRGQQRPSIPAADRDYFDAVTETAQAVRSLVEMIQARQAR
jgi:hypothetical protein